MTMQAQQREGNPILRLPLVIHPRTGRPLECTRQMRGERNCFGTLRRVDDPTEDRAVCPDCNNLYAVQGVIAHLDQHGYPASPNSGYQTPAVVQGDGWVEVNGVRYYEGGAPLDVEMPTAYATATATADERPAFAPGDPDDPTDYSVEDAPALGSRTGRRSR